MNVYTPSMSPTVAPDEVTLERLARRDFSELLWRCVVAAAAAVFSVPFAVTLLISLALMFPALLNSWVSHGDMLSFPLVAMLIAFVAALIGIVPALLVCVPLWALLLRCQAGGWLSFACVGAVPGLMLLAWETELGLAFLLYGIPCGLMVWWLVRRWACSDQV